MAAESRGGGEFSTGGGLNDILGIEFTSLPPQEGGKRSVYYTSILQ